MLAREYVRARRKVNAGGTSYLMISCDITRGEERMAQVVIRKIDDDAMARLKARARRKGVSL